MLCFLQLTIGLMKHLLLIIVILIKQTGELFKLKILAILLLEVVFGHIFAEA